MSQQYLVVNGGGVLGNPKKAYMIKTYSFTTDEDDIGGPSNTRSISLNSFSTDNYNNEDDSSTNSKKLRRRRLQRQTEVENQIEQQNVLEKKKSRWYKKVDLLKPLMVISLIIFLYFMWIKRDVWMHRLIMSKIHLRRSIVTKNDIIIVEGINSSSNTSLNEDIIENIQDNIQKTNLRLQRSQITLNKESQKKKRRHSQNSSINNEKDQAVPPMLTSSSPTKKKHQNRSIISRGNDTVYLSTHDDMIKQLRKNLRSRSRDRNFLSKLSKRTGLSRDQLYRFIYKKNAQPITLQTFVVLLDTFHLILLIVPR